MVMVLEAVSPKTAQHMKNQEIRLVFDKAEISAAKSQNLSQCRLWLHILTFSAFSPGNFSLSPCHF
jgi:hypothetical protein